MKTYYIIFCIVAIFIIVWVASRKKSGFTSPGTMVQLATSHVPTQEDVDYYRNIYPKMVRRDLTDLTGEDPGPISVPYPQLWF
jgi:hypothetical protein